MYTEVNQRGRWGLRDSQVKPDFSGNSQEAHPQTHYISIGFLLCQLPGCPLCYLSRKLRLPSWSHTPLVGHPPRMLYILVPHFTMVDSLYCCGFTTAQLRLATELELGVCAIGLPCSLSIRELGLDCVSPVLQMGEQT